MSPGGMSEAFGAVVQMATEKRRFKKAHPRKTTDTWRRSRQLTLWKCTFQKRIKRGTRHVTECSPPLPVRISRMCKKVNAACNYTCSFPQANFVESSTLHTRNVAWNSPRNFLLLLLFCFLSLSLSLFPLYTQPPLQNVRMWQLSALCPRQNRTRNCPGNCPPVLQRARRVEGPLFVVVERSFGLFVRRWLSPVGLLVHCEKKTDSLRTLLCFLLLLLLHCAFAATAKEFVCESDAGFFGNSIDCKAFVYCNKQCIGVASSWFQCLIHSDLFLFLLLFVKQLGFFCFCE